MVRVRGKGQVGSAILYIYLKGTGEYKRISNTFECNIILKALPLGLTLLLNTLYNNVDATMDDVKIIGLVGINIFFLLISARLRE
jgi:hypothetical protein